MEGMNPAYDVAITVFSPDGRLFQVQYAQEAVKRGTPAVGLEYKDGVLLLATKNLSSPLMVSNTLRKIFKIDSNVGMAISGLVADARRLVELAREEAQKNKFLYNEPSQVGVLTREICELKQAHTHFASARPFGVSLLIGGVDKKGKHVFETDPSGAFTEHYAKAIGAKAEQADSLLEQRYKENMDFDGALILGMKVLHEISDNALGAEGVDGVYIDDKGFHEISKPVIEKHLRAQK
jgi:proteasome alpha subunit